MDIPKPDAEIDPEKFCSDEAVEFDASSLRNAKVNNLGGMGPGGRGSGRYAGKPVIAYECGIKSATLGCVDVVISSVKQGRIDRYNQRHTDSRLAGQYQRQFRRSPAQFIAAYNGDKRPGVAAIGALVPGEYEFEFSFYNGRTGEPVEIPYLPMTFYDLDGKNDINGGATRYEVAYTKDAEGVVSFKHSTLADDRKMVHKCSDSDGVCIVESVTQEVEIPRSFDTLTPAEKSAAATFLFAHKKSIKLTYKLNYGHRVFLFKGSKSLYCDEFKIGKKGGKRR